MTSLNIRPFGDALRSTGSPWLKAGDNRIGGERVVTLESLYRGTDPVMYSPKARAGDRWLRVQLWGNGEHRVSHMVVTCDCDRDNHVTPTRLRGITRPTAFRTPAEMLLAIQVELLRGDHMPPPATDKAPLDQRTSMLVDRFAFALKEKLLESQDKYGWTVDWAKDDWQDRCSRVLCEHLAKGDPRDVAAFAAFMWHHDWPTSWHLPGEGNADVAQANTPVVEGVRKDYARYDDIEDAARDAVDRLNSVIGGYSLTVLARATLERARDDLIARMMQEAGCGISAALAALSPTYAMMAPTMETGE